MIEQQPPQDSTITCDQHTYQVTATEWVIVRWCPLCGKTWTIQSDVCREFSNIWKEVKEQ